MREVASLLTIFGVTWGGAHTRVFRALGALALATRSYVRCLENAWC